MKITVAKSAGYCFGVSRAVNIVEELLDKGEKVTLCRIDFEMML